MKEYLFSLFEVCLLSGIVSSLSPDGSVKKYIRFICSLLVICAMVIPIFSANISEFGFEGVFDLSGDEQEDYGEIYNYYWEAYDTQRAEEALAEGLCTRFSLPTEALRVQLCTEGSGEQRRIISARVYITSASALATDPSLIREYIASVAACECEIVYDIE